MTEQIQTNTQAIKDIFSEVKNKIKNEKVPTWMGKQHPMLLLCQFDITKDIHMHNLFPSRFTMSSHYLKVGESNESHQKTEFIFEKIIAHQRGQLDQIVVHINPDIKGDIKVEFNQNMNNLVIITRFFKNPFNGSELQTLSSSHTNFTPVVEAEASKYVNLTPEFLDEISAMFFYHAVKKYFSLVDYTKENYEALIEQCKTAAMEYALEEQDKIKAAFQEMQDRQVQNLDEKITIAEVSSTEPDKDTTAEENNSSQ